MKTEVMGMKWTLVFAIIFGVLIAPSAEKSVSGSFYDWYDAHNPVVRWHGELVSQAEDFVLVRVSGEKLRECDYVPASLESYAVRASVRFDAREQRVDGIEGATSRPVGPANLGVWKLWPVKGADSVEMWIAHECSGRIVRSKMVDVALPKK